MNFIYQVSIKEILIALSSPLKNILQIERNIVVITNAGMTSIRAYILE